MSAGIAVLGCFEALQPGCPSPHAVTSVSEEGLATLLAYLSSRFHLTPTATVTIFQKTLAVISGHRDAGSTLCPGSNLYGRMDAIRANVASLLLQLGGGTPELRASLIGHTVVPAGFTNTKQWVQLQFRNTGSLAWERDALRLKITGADETARSNYAEGSWGYDFGEFQPQESTIASGEVATFIFSWTLPKTPGNYEHKFHLRAWDRVVEGVQQHSKHEPIPCTAQSLPVKTFPSPCAKHGNQQSRSVSKMLALQHGDEMSNFNSMKTRGSCRNLAFDREKPPLFKKILTKSTGILRQVFQLLIPSRTDIVVDGGSWERLMRVD